MPEVKYDRQTMRFDVSGLELNRPVDSCKDGKWPFLQNVRPTQTGDLVIRPGLQSQGAVVAGQGPVHSIRQLNDPRTGTFTWVIGTGTHLAVGMNPYTDVAGGFSGEPLALVPYRPDQSPEAWMYVADSLQMTKVNVSGTQNQIGLPTPTTAPEARLGTVYFFIVTLADATAGWANAGTAGAPTLIDRVPIATTITAILYDSGTNGFACIQPSSMNNIGPGAMLQLDSAGVNETTEVQEVHSASTSTTIARITYDAGVNGACSIILTTPRPEIEANSMILIAGTEYARVLSVTSGPQTGQSLRCVTTGTRVAGDTLVAVASFRAATVATFVAGQTINTSAIESVVAAGTGTLTLTGALDISQFAAGVPISNDDYMHISFRADTPANITTLRVMLDVDSATNDFTRNYYYKSFTGATDLTPQGNSQWVELKWKLSELTRVGTDDTRTLRNVAAIRIEVVTTGAGATIDFDSWWVGGGFGPDVLSGTGVPYLYRYRARVSSTGARSNPSPSTRIGGGIIAFRQQVAVSMAQYTLATEADVLDIERFGGEVPEWHYVGTTPNSATPNFVDVYSDSDVQANPLSLLEDSQPWSIIDIPRSGTTGDVAGTTVNDSGSNFNTSWAQGTTIKINGIPYTIYRVISNMRLEIVENAGSQTMVSWQVDEPVLVSQSLPCLWGPVNEVMFACGDNTNPGRLYFWQPGKEGTTENNFIDITSPSEPLMNGLVYNGRSYVLSSERLFQILPTGNVSIPWRYEEVPNGKGLFSRWALTRQPGPEFQFLAKDGIYTCAGGGPKSLTDADMFPLFPNEGNLGIEVNGIKAPSIIAANQPYLRLDYYDDYLYFNYLDTSSTRRTLIFIVDRNGWWFDIYTPGAAVHVGAEGPGVHRLLVGGTDLVASQLYSLDGTGGDETNPIAYLIGTPSLDQNDPRRNKRYGDVMIDVNPGGSSITAKNHTNNDQNVYTPHTITGAVRAQFPIDFNGSWVTAKNVGFELSGSILGSSRPTFYIFEPRWTLEPAGISAYSYEVAETTHGIAGFKHLGACRLTHVSTADLTLTVTVDGIAQTPITITNSGGIYVTVRFRFPVYKGRHFKYRLSSTAEFRLDERDSFFEVGEWARQNPYQELRIFSEYALIEG